VGLAFLTPADLVPLQSGEAEPGGPLALIGAGTGLGQGFLTRSSGGYEMHPSEGGHSSFAPSTPREWRLRECLEKRYGPVSWERVVSGPGLAAVYACLTGAPSPLSPPEISERGMNGTDPAAAETLDIFAAAFGAQAGNLALTVLATGGVYVAGGIAPHIMPKLQDGTFIRAFRSKGELEPLLRRIPVQVITSSHAGLLGAAAVAAPPRTRSPAGGNT
jgi:glucokinase